MKTSLRQRSAAAVLVGSTALGVCVPAGAAPANVVTLDFAINSNDDVAQLSVTGGNRIYMLGFTDLATDGGIFGLDLTNPLGNTFGSQGRFLAGPRGLVVHSDGSFADLEINQGVPNIVIRDPHGAAVGNPIPVAISSATLAGAQSDGKLLVGGAFDRPCLDCNTPEAKVIRLNTDGSVDQTFNSVQIPAPGTWVTQAVTRPDGKIVLRFGAATGTIALLNSDGSLAAGFGLNSQVSFTGAVHAVAVDSQNRIYVSSGTNVLQRLLDDGSIDSTFDATAAAATGTFTAMKLDSMQRPIVFGYVPGTGGTRTSTALIARLTTTGALDTTFATTGTIAVPLPKPLARFTDRTCTGDIQTDDKPVIACNIEGEAVAIPQDVALAKYNVDGTADATLGATVPDFQYYPDAFAFQSATAAYGAAYVVSNPITISGTNIPTSLSVLPAVQGGAVSVGCTGQYTNQAPALEPGQTFCVRGSAAAQPSGSAVITVNVGGRQETFTINSTNTPANTTPDAFSFANQTNVEPSATVKSNVVTITGITGFAAVTVSGDNGLAKFIIGCGSDNQGQILTGSNQIGPGQTICVQQLASSTPGESETATLTVGGVSASFTITTKAAASAPPPTNTGGGGSSGSSGGGGAFDELSLAALATLTLLAARHRKRLDTRRS